VFGRHASRVTAHQCAFTGDGAPKTPSRVTTQRCDIQSCFLFLKIRGGARGREWGGGAETGGLKYDRHFIRGAPVLSSLLSRFLHGLQQSTTHAHACTRTHARTHTVHTQTPALSVSVLLSRSAVRSGDVMPANGSRRDRDLKHCAEVPDFDLSSAVMVLNPHTWSAGNA
jgi:hypothetical protein